MAFLMLLHEKLRLQRKINKLTMRQLKASSRKERMTKSIARVQKMYSTRQTRLQNWAKIMESQFKSNLYNSAGLGTQNQMFNPMYGGMTSFVANQLAGMLSGGVVIGRDSDGKNITSSQYDNATIQAMFSEYNSGTLRAQYDQDGKPTGKYGSNGDYTEEDFKAFNIALHQAQNNQAMAQSYCQQIEGQYQNNISIWLERAQEDLEAEQDAMLAPLEEQETEWDMESQSCETQLADARARLDGIKQALSEGIKDSAPNFGLG